MTATFIRKVIKGNDADQALYKLDPPIVNEAWGDEEAEEWEYVVVSAVLVLGADPETYIFGSNEEGEIQHWGELEGSAKGILDHEQALANAGYTLAPNEVAT